MGKWYHLQESIYTTFNQSWIHMVVIWMKSLFFTNESSKVLIPVIRERAIYQINEIKRFSLDSVWLSVKHMALIVDSGKIYEYTKYMHGILFIWHPQVINGIKFKFTKNRHTSVLHCKVAVHLYSWVMGNPRNGVSQIRSHYSNRVSNMAAMTAILYLPYLAH